MTIHLTKKQRNFQVIPSWIIIAFAILSFIGFFDASYLTATHYLGIPPNCSVLGGCEQVTTSEYSTVFGVPISLGGAVYYVLLLILSVAYLDTKNKKILSALLPITTLGFIASVWFVYIQLFVIKAICIYCMLSAVITTILFILSILVLKYREQDILWKMKQQ